MVYEKECSECGKLIEFGGREVNQNLPDNAIEFDGKIYCQECVQEFIEFGTGAGEDVMGRIEDIEDAIEKIEDELGLQRHL